MAHIGSFKEISNGFEGEVFMPPLTSKGVRVVKLTTPNANKKAPTHRIYVGRSDYAELGLCEAISKIPRKLGQ